MAEVVVDWLRLVWVVSQPLPTVVVAAATAPFILAVTCTAILAVLVVLIAVELLVAATLTDLRQRLEAAADQAVVMHPVPTAVTAAKSAR